MINGKIAILNCTLIDGTGKDPLNKAVIYIENEKIKAVGGGGEVDIPKDAKTIDVQGKTVIPGLIDSHLHFSGGRPASVGTRAQRAKKKSTERRHAREARRKKSTERRRARSARQKIH